MKLTYLIAATLLAAPLSSVPAQLQEKQTPAEFDAYVTKAVSDWQSPGLAVAVVKDGKLVFAKGYGVREVGKPGAFDTSTVSAIASTTKAMTAVAMGMLVDEGKLKWDDPVTKYLPSFQLYDPYVTREITVRDLLTHRAGLGNTDYLWALADRSASEIVNQLRLVKPSYSMRSSFLYQNSMYIVAGEVIAAVSGMPWSRFVATRIFEPLGMRNTYPLASQVPPAANAATPHWRFGRDTIVAIKKDEARAIGPAGDVWSSVGDMSKWMLFLLDSARVNGKRLLEADTYAELFKPQVLVPPEEFYPTAEFTKPHWTTYALGWFQHDYRGRMLDFHTGSLNGMVSIVGLVPDERFGVYVLANRDHVEIRHALMYRAIDTWLGDPPRDWSRDLLALYESRRAAGDSARQAYVAKRIKGTRPSLALSKYAGVYEDVLLGRVTVTEVAGKLRIDLGPALDGDLEHWQYDTFRARYDDRWQGTDMVSFTIGEGRPSSMSIAGFTLKRLDGAGAAAH